MIRRSWTRAASIEETLALWAASLREVKKRIRPLFRQERVATNAGLFLEGLLGDEQRKTGWMREEAAGDPGPWRQQALLGRDQWEADALRDTRVCRQLRIRRGAAPLCDRIGPAGKAVHLCARNVAGLLGSFGRIGGARGRRKDVCGGRC